MSPFDRGQTVRLRVRRLCLTATTIGVATLSSHSARAQPNDQCINATVVSGLPYSNSLTTNLNTDTDGPAPSCQFDYARDVWWTYTPISNASVTFSTCNSNYDTVLTIYSGTCGALTELACNDDDCGIRSRVTVNVVAAATYLIRVVGYQGRTGNLTFEAALSTARPANDLCTNATVIASLPYSNTVLTNTSTTAEGPPASCQANAGRDIWWVYTPPANQVLHVSTCNSPLLNTVLTVLTGTCAAPTEVACSDDDCGFQRSSITLNVAAGTPYRIRAAGFNNTTGAITLDVSAQSPAPPNDQCGAALPIACGMQLIGTLAGATLDSPPAPADCPDSASIEVVENARNGVWYKLTGSGQNITLTTCNGVTNVDTQISVFDGGCGALNCVVANDDQQPACSSFPLASSVTFVAQSGVDYLILVTPFLNNTPTFDFRLDASCAAACANCYGDMDTDNVVDGGDIAPFIECLANPLGNCGCADFNASGGADVGDLPGFVAKLLEGGCP